MKTTVIIIMSIVILIFVIILIKFAITKPSDGTDKPKYL